MKCIFCKNLNIKSASDPTYSFCLTCSISYYENSHGNMYPNYPYTWDNPYFQFALNNTIVSSNDAARVIFRDTIITKWTVMPNINPTNIKEKLKLYMLFS